MLAPRGCMDDTTFRLAMDIILEEFPVDTWSSEMNPFETLVAVIISQNTTVVNERRALRRLQDLVGISPRAVATAAIRDLREALRPAGLHRTKAPRIKEIARRLLEEYDGDLGRILALPLKEARFALTSLPGVGPKTADVVLNLVGGFPTFPVDTHIWRIARRWDLTPGRTYEEVRGALEALVPPDERRRAHLSLIKLGRTTCQARNPKCPTCPVQDYCPFSARLLRNDQ